MAPKGLGISGDSARARGFPPKGLDMGCADAIHAACTAAVQDLVGARRARGVQLALAIREVARELGLTPRRVRAWWHGEVRSVPAWEHERLREAARQARLRRIAALECELEALRAERAGMGERDGAGDSAAQGLGLVRGEGGGCGGVAGRALPAAGPPPAGARGPSARPRG